MTLTVSQRESRKSYASDGCTFVHSEAMNPPICRFDLRCRKDECVYKHSNDCSQRVGCTKQGCIDRHVVIKQDVDTRKDLQDGKSVLDDERDDVAVSLDTACTDDDWSVNIGQKSSSQSKHVYPVKRKMYVQSVAQDQ